MGRFGIVAIAAALVVLASTLAIVRVARRARVASSSVAPPPLAQIASPGGTPTAKEAPARDLPARDSSPRETREDAINRLDLLRIGPAEDGLVAPTQAGAARLTLDPGLQRAATTLLAAHHLPEAALVLMDVATGRLLAYATHVEHGAARDMCSEATAPSASVFKIVTAAALVEDAHLGAETTQCYSGGAEKITSLDLIDDPKRDRWCSTLAGAMGRSINTVFARLARSYLEPHELEAMARRFGYGEPLTFDVPVQPSGLRIPSDPLEFARTAAGFWNTTLSPLEAAELSAVVAHRGESVRPRIVDRVEASNGAVVWSAPSPEPSHRVIAPETAEELATMMQRTVAEGTCRRAFHDGVGRAFLPGIPVAGKTGTLT
ncbi:MAG TPA: penicillin-binding transpeptidase domain-containing protein, partial [Polyangiaceae bacterium]|nr:penicillin-binding transpeptidase domain-containing protein [Polyangiaceae bacterium]